MLKRLFCGVCIHFLIVAFVITDSSSTFTYFGHWSFSVVGRPRYTSRHCKRCLTLCAGCTCLSSILANFNCLSSHDQMCNQTFNQFTLHDQAPRYACRDVWLPPYCGISHIYLMVPSLGRGAFCFVTCQSTCSLF